MGSEAALWNTLRKGMQGRWRAQRFEDKLSEGIPDLCYALKGVHGLGFLELKYLPAFPKRDSTIVRIPHPKRWKLQRAWMMRMGDWSGRVGCLIQVGREYFLFDWSGIAYIGAVSELGFRSQATCTWQRSIDFDELTLALRC
jgi:hypothetical protein